MSGTLTPFANPLIPSQADYLLFIRQYMQISPAFLPDDSLWITASYNVAVGQVYCALNLASPQLYTFAVYNYAGDRLIHFAVDQPGQVYFREFRAAIGVNSFAAGLIQSSSDSGTSQAMAVPDWVRMMTMTDLEMAKTPYGQTYLGLAQNLGATIWGLS